MQGPIHSLEEAQEWFIEHSTGSILCVLPDGSRKECFSFPEAKQFFEGAS